MNPRCTHPKAEANRCKLCQTWNRVTSGQALAPVPNTPSARPPCIHLGQKIVGQETGCIRKCWHICDAGRGQEGRTRPGIECQSCEFHKVEIDEPEAKPVGNRIVIDHGAGGLGDWLLGACVVAKFKADNPDKHIVYNAGKVSIRNPQAFGALFVGVADEIGECDKVHSDAPVRGAVQLNVGYNDEDLGGKPTNKRSSIWSMTRWERYARNLGSTGYLIPSLKEPDRILGLGRDVAGYVALCPFSADSSREWSVHHWHTLERRLIESGYRTCVLHSEAARTEGFRGVKIIGEKADRVAACLLNAACVVACDSGLAHLGGILRRPTIVLGGWLPVDRIYSLYPGFRGIQGELDCSGCCNGKPMDTGSRACRPSCANLNSIGVDRVLNAVDEVVLTGIADRSLVDWKRLRTLRDGGVAELGVYRGGSAKLIRHYATGTLHLFDTFAGIPETDSEAGGHKAGDFPSDADAVQAYVGDAVLHVGKFPATALELARYRFVHVDADTYQSTKAAIEYFVPRMTPGGRIVFDDYGWENCPGVMKAIQEAKLKPERSAEYQAVVRC